MRQKIKQVWGTVPSWLKWVLSLMFSIVGFIIEAAADNADSCPSDAAETEQLDELREKLYFDSNGDLTGEMTQARYLPGGK